MTVLRVVSGALTGLFLAAGALANNLALAPLHDSMVTQQSPGTPQGTNVVMLAGTNGQNESSRSLLTFGLSGIPTNAVVTSAALTVKVVKVAPGFPASGKMDLRRLLVPWADDQATWTNRLASVRWSTNGAAAPVDFATDITQTITVTDAGTYTFVSNSNMIANVQGWVNNPSANFGWIIVSELQGTLYSECKFGTLEDPAHTASLIIQFTVPPVLVPLPVLDGQFRFRFDAESNRTYAVEYRGSLLENDWNALTNLPSSVTNVAVTVSDPLSTNRLYRVRTP